jgi:Ca2+-binding RTX toxin-like protein
MTTRVFRGINYTVETITSNSQKINGTSGNDWFEVSGSNNSIETGQGNDVVLAGVEFLFIDSYPPFGGDSIFFNTLMKDLGNTTINTGTGNDYVVVGPGNYAIALGNGNNIVDAATTAGHIQVSAGNGNDIIDVGGLGTYRVDAGGGNNWIYMAAGNACVSAGSGNDVVTTTNQGIGSLLFYLLDLEGQPYTQRINLGNGNNQIALPVFGESEMATGSGQDFILALSISASIGGAINSDVVKIDSGSGNDTVVTIDTKSLIRLGSGNDTVFAGAGDDTIYVGSGRNTINLRGGDVSIPDPVNNFSAFGAATSVQGGGNDTVYLKGGQDTIVLGSSGFATVHGFTRNDLLDVRGLNATFSRMGNDTLISSGSSNLGILRGYTGSVGLV